MPDVYESRRTVSAEEIDELGHANNVAYLQWMMAAARAHTEAQGWPMERYRTCGFGWVVRSHHIDYLRPAAEGEEIRVRTWVADFAKATSRRRYEVLRAADAALLARAVTEWAFVDLGTGTLRRVPPEVSGSFTIVKEGSPPAAWKE